MKFINIPYNSRTGNLFIMYKIERTKEAYYKFVKKDFVLPNGKKISDEEKLKSLQEFIEEFIDELEK